MDATDCQSLWSQCSELNSKYFTGVLHAPTSYTSLGRALEWLGYNMRQLSNQKATKGLDRLATHRVESVLEEVRNFLQSQKVSKDKPAQWWSNFAQKARFGLKETFENLINKVEYHSWLTILVLRSSDSDVVNQRLPLFEQTGQAIDSALNLLLAPRQNSTAPNGSQDADILNKFSSYSDYYGRDIFEVAKIFTPLHLLTFWTYQCGIDLKALDQSGPVPVEAYGNLLKSAWLLRRLYHDRRLEKAGEGFRVAVIILAEEVLYQMKRIVELNLSLPSTKQLNSEADFRTWVDDLEDYEMKSDKDEIYEDDDEMARRTPPTQPLKPDVATPGSQTNGVPASPAGPSQDEQLQPPNGSESRVSNRMYKNDSNPNGHIDVSPGRDELSAQIYPEVAPERTDIDQQWNGYAPVVNCRTSTSSQESETLQQRNVSVQAAMPRTNHSRRGPLPAPVSARADARSDSSRSHSIDSSGNNQGHMAQQPTHRPYHSPDSMRYGVPPLHTHNNTFNTHFNGHPRRQIEEDSDPQPYDPRFPPDMYGETGRGLDPRDNGERPGEKEIMKDVFAKMTMFASESLKFNPMWETCSVKIFRSGVPGVRILTFRESGVDQRFVPLKEAEMIPEYGYHKDFPVIWLRRLRPDGPDTSYPTPSTKRPFSDVPAASLYYRFESAHDMFNFQVAFTGEAVETDVMSARTVRFKRSFIDGEHSHYKARVQLWKETSTVTGAGAQSPTTGSIAGTFRSRGESDSLLKVHTTRMVVYFDEVFLVLFVTDSITAEARGKSSILRIKPSSYRAFGNPASVRARLLGNRKLSGGFRLDREGLGIQDEDSFDEFKWLEIDFNTEEEMSCFKSDFAAILKDRRRERRQVEELKRLASNGVRSAR